MSQRPSFRAAIPLVVVSALAGFAASCATLKRDPFPGSFRAGMLNDNRADLFHRPRGIDTPTRFGEGASAAWEAPRVRPLPSSFVAGVPPWPAPAAKPSKKSSRDLRAARTAKLGKRAIDGTPAPRVPPLSSNDEEPRQRLAPPTLAAWLKHGENPQLRRARIASFAASLVGVKKVVVGGRRFASNCTDFVRAVFSIESVDLYYWPGRPRGFAGVRGMYGLAAKTGGLHFKKTPELGDLVFFHHTYDFNKNGRIDDFLSHVAVVEKIDGDGTVHYVDYAGGRARRGRLNPRVPYRWRDPQSLKQLNSYLRRRKKSDPAGTRYLAGDLFAGFGTLIR